MTSTTRINLSTTSQRSRLGRGACLVAGAAVLLGLRLPTPAFAAEELVIHAHAPMAAADLDRDGVPDEVDGDGVGNDIEVRNGTSPRNINDRPVDRDGDGYFDADEERAGSDPGNGQQTPGDRDGDGQRVG